MERFKIGGLSTAAAIVAIITASLVVAITGYALAEQPELSMADTINIAISVVAVMGAAVAAIYVLRASSVAGLLVALRALSIFMLIAIIRAAIERLMEGGGASVGLLPIVTIMLIVLAVRDLSKRGLVGPGSVFTVKPLQ